MSEAHMRAIMDKIQDDLVTAELSRASTLSVENQALRDEVARLNRAMSIATIALRYYSETAIGARAVDALEKIEAKS